jgi:prophage regulatory protein
MSNFEHPRILEQHQLNQFTSAAAEGKLGTTEKIIRMPAVLSTVGLSRATIYRLISVGDFPKPIKLGRHASGWLQSAIQSWINQRAGRQWV